MAKINLLFVITKLELGGAQKQLLDIIGGLDRQAYNIFLFTAKDGLLMPEVLSLSGVTVKRSGFLERNINPLKDILALLEIYNFIKKNRIQIVHTHSSKAGVLGRLSAALAGGRIILHTVHGWSFHSYQPFIVNRLYRLLERICAKFTHKIIVVSLWDKDKGIKNGVGKEGQYVLIRYGIDQAVFSKQKGSDALRSSWGLASGELAVGMIACFKPQKSPLDFIRLAYLISREIEQVKFILVGDGVLLPKVRGLIRKLNLEGRVILSGWRGDIPLVLSCLDVFVLTSLWEGLPIVVLEAMASGVPLVVTDTGGIREVVQDGQTGYLVKTRDLSALNNQVTGLLKDAAKRKMLAQAAKAVAGAKEFSLSNMVKATEGLYSDLAKRRPGHA